MTATGAAPAIDPTVETKTETPGEACKTQPATLKERIGALLRTIFEGRDEYVGWRQ
ncbi:MAG: hypothetical protein ABSH02_02240 [Candidatus Sulfotelmatobacter sp.]|jgi:hypothetical protein